MWTHFFILIKQWSVNIIEQKTGKLEMLKDMQKNDWLNVFSTLIDTCCIELEAEPFVESEIARMCLLEAKSYLLEDNTKTKIYLMCRKTPFFRAGI